MKPTQIVCLVGDIPNDCPESPTCDFGAGYFATPEQLLKQARKLCTFKSTIQTNRPDAVTALMAMVKMREINLKIRRYDEAQDSWQEFDIDVKGEFIQPWPDNFFELGFHLRFHDYSESVENN